MNTENAYQKGLEDGQEFLQHMIEEDPNLGERWRLVVKQPQAETPVEKLTLKDYWWV